MNEAIVRTIAAAAQLELAAALMLEPLTEFPRCETSDAHPDRFDSDGRLSSRPTLLTPSLAAHV